MSWDLDEENIEEAQLAAKFKEIRYLQLMDQITTTTNNINWYGPLYSLQLKLVYEDLS